MALRPLASCKIACRRSSGAGNMAVAATTDTPAGVDDVGECSGGIEQSILTAGCGHTAIDQLQESIRFMHYLRL